MKANLLIIIMLSTLISACFPVKPTTNDKDDECIPPLYNIAFPVVTSSPSDSAVSRQIPPKGNWQMQESLPFPQDEIGSIYLRLKQNELLFTGQFDKIFIYSIDNKQWRSYQVVDRVSDGLFVSKEGEIWGAGTLFADNSHSGKSYPYLRRFNDATGSFEFVEDGSGFLQARQTRLVSNIAEDQSRLLWFLVETNSGYTLTSFNVKTSKSQQHYSLKQVGVTDLVIGTDGSVWLLDKSEDQLVQYIPSSQETRMYEFPNSADTGKLPFNFDRAAYIYMDRTERLWLANYGWLEFSDSDSPVWNRVVESPVFIIDSGQLPASQYTMAYQTSTYQSSNGWYWFTGSGIVRLDLEQGSWCLITTESSKVVEDNDHNLWIAVLGHLYKYDLNTE